MKPKFIHHLILATALLWAMSAPAQLYIVITPGHTFVAGETPTVESLNELGMPTAAIYGTLSSNSVAPGTINGVQLADTLPDGGTLSLPPNLATMGWNSASPRQLSVNTAGLCNGLGGIYGNVQSNQLYLLIDPAFFLLATNTLGSTNAGTGNTGGWNTNWLTLKPYTLGDSNMVPHGISSASLGNLATSTTITEQILTNVYDVANVLITNTVTNFNTAFVGNTNGFGVLAQLGPGLFVTNFPTVFTFTTNATTYTYTNNVPTLALAGYNGSFAPLIVNAYNWTNSQMYVTANNNYTSAVITAAVFGGEGPYTHKWTVVNHTFSSSVNAFYLTGTNAAQTSTVISPQATSGGNYTVELEDIVTDASGQMAVSPPVYTYLYY